MPAGLNRPTSDIEPIVGIQFGIFSPDEIERRSVVEITNAGTYDGNEPRIGGLFDPRMGVLDNGKTCRSCGQTNHSCPGHFGHFKLARPVYFIQFFPHILNVLNCICVRCSKLLIDKTIHKEIYRRTGEQRWRAVLNICSSITRCGQEGEDGCGARQPERYVRDGIARIVAEWDSIEGPGQEQKATKQRQYLEVEYVLRLFRRITDEDVDFIGLNRFWCRPDWMICSVMPIPPPQVRPSVIQDNNQRSEDDLTHKLFEIIMTNNRLQDKINNNLGKNLIEDEHTVLQYHIATLVDNQIPGVAPSAQRSGRPLKSVQQRLGSKEGRIRYNIQGKRVEFSARSVITPDPNISIAELGMPMKIAMNLTFPEKVTPYNITKMYKLIQNVGPNGEERHPGAKTIVRADGRMISLRHINRKEIVLHMGDVVNRHIMDGDIVLFNRQPTLHRMSMMGHRVKVLPYNTFRLNVSVTAPYNADFDGDEMNAHIPQSYETATELLEIAAVPHQIVTPRHAKPVIGIVQDTLVGSYRITRPQVSFNRREFMNMMMWNRRFEGAVPKGANDKGGKQRWTGQQILSQLLPPINMDMGNGMYKDNKVKENFVRIREGEIQEGIFDKDIFSKPSKGIIHTVFKDYGPTDTVNFIDSMQNTVEQFLVYNGFSVGVSDLVADEDTRKRMEEVIKKRKVAIEDTLLQIHMDLFDNNTGKSNRQEFEDKVYGELNKATEEAGKIGLGSLSDENRLVAMVRAGSKGSTINIAQMMACVGQQAPEGRRIPYGFTDRTLPHYKKYDDGAEARGFVESSFIEGLTPQEFFFHAMSGREGLIDTAVKTADTGYIQRQLVKAMEDLTTQYDGTVRDSRMNILQFQYGEDGINATKIESVSLGIGKLSEEEILKQYGMTGVDIAGILEAGSQRGEDSQALAEFATQVVADRKMLVEGIQRMKQDAPLFASVNLERVLTNVSVSFRLGAEKKTDLTPLYVIAGIERLIQRTQTKHALWAALLRYYLSPHKIIVKERFTKKAFDTACEMILVKNWQSWVQPGEQVGIIAAQSIGEPSTQMSAVASTIVHVINVKTGENYCGPISGFIDPLIGPTKAEVSSVLRTELDTYRIVGVSKDEMVSWMPISEVSRHPANGGLVKVTTRSGRTTTATLSHSFLHRTEKGVEAILGSDLRVGTRIPIANQVAESPKATTTVGPFKLNKAFGWLCGIYLADGSLGSNTVRICKIHPVVESTIRTLAAEYGWEVSFRDYQGEFGPSKDNIIHSKELRNFMLSQFKTGSYEKTLGADVFSYSREFQYGLLSGYFDGDGNVSADRHMIRVGSRSESLIRSVNRLLSYCGIFGVLGKETSVRIPGKVSYTINILKKYATLFKQHIGFSLQEKAAALDTIVAWMERDGKHDTKELYDKIPALGDYIAALGKSLNMPGQSRNYGRWAKKESVGRLTLRKYIEDFAAAGATKAELAPLLSAAYSDVVWDEIVDLEYLDDPKEFVYDFTVPGNDSFMVDDCILVHNTLNSVDWDTKIMIAKNGQIVCTDIGEFVDTHMAAVKPEAIQRFPNDQLYLDLNDGNDWQAISCDEDGQMMWTKLEAVTRHPVVNEDGTNTILEVTTASGRTVKGTKGKSFLNLVDGKIVGVNGSDLKVGDCLPIANSLAIKNGLSLVDSIAVRDYLPPTEWLYGTDAQEALAALNGTDRHWFQKNNGSVFTVPYSRSDSFREAFVDGKNTNAAAIKPGFVYPARTRPDVSQIPEKIALTESFGFFVGAYLAEGSSNATQVNITNNEPAYLERVQALMKEWNVGTHGVCEERAALKTGIKGTTTSLVIHSTLLATLMQRLFGRISHEKTLPDWVFQAPDEFIEGLVDGYVSGDGSVEKGTGCVKATSVSKELLVRFGTLLARYGIFSTMSERTPELGVFDSVRTNYTMYIPVKYSAVFAKTFRLSIQYKQDTLNQHFIQNTTERKCRRDTTGEVVWDPITSIKEVVPIKNLVYDLTVEGTRNFMTHSCHINRDTFHLAGVAAKSNVTRGVPRLKELLKVTQNPKAISLTVYLKPEFRGSKDKARQVAQDLELTLLKDITVKTAIYFDPKDAQTVVEEDTDLIQFFRLFEKEAEEGTETNWSGWLLRFEMDRNHMFRKNISMDDVAYVLRTRFGESLHLIYSDYNSDKLIMRMRLPEQMKGGLDDLTNLKKFQNRVLNGIVFRGVPGVKSVSFREDKDMLELTEGSYKEVRQYVLDTDGSNYLQVMNHPYVDATRLSSSHVHDIYEILGIEATRAVLLNEITTLFEEAGVNNRHLGLLCDVMTRGGRLMPSDRHGINKTDIGPLAKASFEETEKILLNAALFGELDPVTGVSANIMTGQVIRGGTGFFNVLLDEGAFIRLQDGLAPVEGYDEEDTGELTQEQLERVLYEDENDTCSSAQLRMNVTLPNATAVADEPDIEVMLMSE
jgi:DNA-directed RNA polymerase beta' subunit